MGEAGKRQLQQGRLRRADAFVAQLTWRMHAGHSAVGRGCVTPQHPRAGVAIKAAKQQMPCSIQVEAR